MICAYCESPYTARKGADDLDFLPSPEYCTIACENAHGEYLELRRQDVERARIAHYRRAYMLEADWRAHLVPTGGLGDRCRNCTTVYIPGDPEFCSAVCEEDFHLAHSLWLRETGQDSADVIEGRAA